MPKKMDVTFFIEYDISLYLIGKDGFLSDKKSYFGENRKLEIKCVNKLRSHHDEIEYFEYLCDRTTLLRLPGTTHYEGSKIEITFKNTEQILKQISYIHFF